MLHMLVWRLVIIFACCWQNASKSTASKLRTEQGSMCTISVVWRNSAFFVYQFFVPLPAHSHTHTQSGCYCPYQLHASYINSGLLNFTCVTLLLNTPKDFHCNSINSLHVLFHLTRKGLVHPIWMDGTCCVCFFIFV